MTEENRKEYLGDGVYAKYDNMGGVWLTAENGYSTINQIYLEDTVFYELKRYWERMYEKPKTHPLTPNDYTISN
jgi:hypothetical protein